jgi:hypothetical protein
VKRFLWLTPIVFLLISATASADSFRILFFPNLGDDNFVVLKQVGIASTDVTGVTIPPDFLATFYEPGSTIGGTAQIFFANGVVDIGGTSFFLQFPAPGTLFMSSFTLPPNGKDFTVSVLLRFSALSTVLDSGQTLDLGGSIIGHLTFHFQNGFYFTDRAGFRQVATVPESGTLGLMATGLAGIVGVIRRKRSV